MNELGNAASPYLQQHKDNPVHWRVWGTVALAEARTAQKPILLSIGYAACHWCHVMAHESFEDEVIAEIINQHFVAIKVDREERPDIDAIYMKALHDLGQQGGWPLTMFLDDEARPFWGGTYFPNPARGGMTGFAQILNDVAELWQHNREQVNQNRDALQAAAEKRLTRKRQGEIAADLPPRMARQLADTFDLEKGGTKNAPKFPNVPMLDFLWRMGLRQRDASLQAVVIKTLEAICLGGICDHLGGGFARYAVDENWQIPHFEKMLYDNALLIWMLSETYRETGNPLFAARVAEAVEFLRRDLLLPDGFAAALDADSLDANGQNKEGAFYVWREDEIDAQLGDRAERFKHAYQVQAAGNWEGVNILFQKTFDGAGIFEEEKKILLVARAQRTPPARDEKIITEWNGLAIAALAHASWVFEKKDWLKMAEAVFAKIQSKLMVAGRLAHSRCGEVIQTPALIEDYAAMFFAALTLYEKTGTHEYLTAAKNYLAIMDSHYASDQGGYYTSADDALDVPQRECIAQDSPIPSANSLIWRGLLMLAAFEGEPDIMRRADGMFHAFGGDVVKDFPSHAGWLAAYDRWRHPMQIILLGDSSMFEKALRKKSLPDITIMHIANSETLPRQHPAFGKHIIDDNPTAYICSGNRCLPAITNMDRLEEILEKIYDQD